MPEYHYIIKYMAVTTYLMAWFLRFYKDKILG